MNKKTKATVINKKNDSQFIKINEGLRAELIEYLRNLEIETMKNLTKSLITSSERLNTIYYLINLLELGLKENRLIWDELIIVMWFLAEKKQNGELEMKKWVSEEKDITTILVFRD